MRKIGITVAVLIAIAAAVFDGIVLYYAIMARTEEIKTVVVDLTLKHQDRAGTIGFVLAFGESLAVFSFFWPATVVLIDIAAAFVVANVEMSIYAWTWLGASIGGALGYTLSYLVGYVYRHQIEVMEVVRKHPRIVTFVRRWFAAEGWRSYTMVFVGHLLGPLRAVVPVLAGAMGMSQLWFQSANIPSSPVWALAVLATGYYGSPWLLWLFS